MSAGAAAVAKDFEIKVVGKSGQISLGKRYAGKRFRVDRREDGSLPLTAIAVIPESELWAFREPDWSRILRGLEWALKTPRAETDLDDLFRMLGKRNPARKLARR